MSSDDAFEYINPRLRNAWPNDVNWSAVRLKMKDAWKTQHSEGETMRELRQLVVVAKRRDMSLEMLNGFLVKMLLVTIHEEESLADINAELRLVEDAENIKVQTERRLCDFYRHTRAHIDLNSLPNLDVYRRMKGVVADTSNNMKHAPQFGKDKTCALLEQLHHRVHEVQTQPEHRQMVAALESLRSATKMIVMDKYQLVLKKEEVGRIEAVTATQNQWYSYTLSKQEELLKEKAQLEEKLDRFLQLDHSEDDAPSRKKPCPKPPKFGNPSVEHAQVDELRRALTRIEASLHVHGHEDTIRRSPYETFFDYRGAVGMHPQMRIAKERARVAEESRVGLLQKRVRFERALDRVHTRRFEEFAKFGPAHIDAIELPSAADVNRIRAAVGPYDVLQLTRDCSEADANRRRNEIQRALGNSSTESDVQTLVNEAFDELFPKTHVLKETQSHTQGTYALDHPLSSGVTSIQIRRDKAREEAHGAWCDVFGRMLDELFLPVMRLLPPSGLRASWFLVKKTTGRICDEPVLALLRHPALRVVSFNLEADDALFDVVDEGGCVRVDLSTAPVRVATVTCALPGGESFAIPFEVVTLSLDPGVLVFPELARAAALKARRPIAELQEHFEDAVLQELSQHAPAHKRSQAPEEWKCRAETRATFRSQLNQRAPPFLSGWPRWCGKFLPNGLDEFEELQSRALPELLLTGPCTQIKGIEKKESE